MRTTTVGRVGGMPGVILWYGKAFGCRGLSQAPWRHPSGWGPRYAHMQLWDHGRGFEWERSDMGEL